MSGHVILSLLPVVLRTLLPQLIHPYIRLHNILWYTVTVEAWSRQKADMKGLNTIKVPFELQGDLLICIK